MSDSERLARLTTLLYALSAALFAGTIVELLSAKHFQEPMQLVPFALCVAGLVTIGVAWKRPSQQSVLALRLVMLITAGGSLLGMWEHIEGNMGFIQEMHPDVTGWRLLLGAITGRAPLLASGALAAAGVIAVVATFAAGWGLRGAPDIRREGTISGEMAPALGSISLK
jgi:hypothetical protein